MLRHSYMCCAIPQVHGKGLTWGQHTVFSWCSSTGALHAHRDKDSLLVLVWVQAQQKAKGDAEHQNQQLEHQAQQLAQQKQELAHQDAHLASTKLQLEVVTPPLCSCGMQAALQPRPIVKESFQAALVTALSCHAQSPSCIFVYAAPRVTQSFMYILANVLHSVQTKAITWQEALS